MPATASTMRLFLLIALLAPAAAAQMPINPARFPARLLDFNARPDEMPLRCEVTPLRPAIDFSFRFQAGYVARVPMSQFTGKGHTWGIVIRITPESGAAVYLGIRTRLPEIPRTQMQLATGGGYLLGEGRYRVAWKLYDDAGRVCRKEWTIDARRTYAGRNIKMALPPHAVTPLYLRTPGREPDDAPPFRLTVLLHAAPISLRRTRLGGRDNMMLLGTLSSLLDRLPTRSVRLVVFNLDQQREIYRRDGFTPDRLQQVAESIENLQLGMVDYHVLQNPNGSTALLANLVKTEIADPQPSDVVLFLGPHSHEERLGAGAPRRPETAGPHFFYLQFRPFQRPEPVFPDAIDALVSKLKGKVVVMHDPGDFERAIGQVERAGR